MFSQMFTNGNEAIPLIANADPTNLSLEELYNQYYKQVYKICLQMLGNNADAEDVTQDTILQIYRKIKSFRGEANFTTWLHRITVNQVLMFFRKSSRRHERVTKTGEISEQLKPLTDRLDSLPSLDRILLATAIKKLPTGYRTIFLLHDVQGYEHEEIAQMLGICTGTSKSQLHKARLKLRKILLSKAKRIKTG